MIPSNKNDNVQTCSNGPSHAQGAPVKRIVSSLVPIVFVIALLLTRPGTAEAGCKTTTGACSTSVSLYIS